MPYAMIVADLEPGAMMDLQNLNLPGAAGISAESELAIVEEWDGATFLYTDLVNLTVSGDMRLELTESDGWAFVDPAKVGVWTW